jgi:hypothetical protein
MSPIPDDELISAYLDDELSREERLRAEQLLLDRADLRRLFEELRGLRQGLRSLPKFSLGDDFGASVLRKAERSVLQSNLPAAAGSAEEDASKAAEAAAGDNATSAAAPFAAAPAKSATSSGPVMPVDRSRLLRPIIYSLTVLAAALALVIYEQVNILERREAPHLAQAPLPNADEAKNAGDGKEAGRKENETAPAAEAADKFKAENAGILRKNATGLRDAAPQDADRDTARKPGDAPDYGRGAAAFAVGNTFGGNTLNGNAANAAAANGVAATPTMSKAMAKGDALLPDGRLDAVTLEGIAVQDFERFQSLIYNSRLPQTKRADGLIDAGRLQEFAASSQVANLGSSQNFLAIDNNLRNGTIAGQASPIASPANGNLTAGADAYQRQQFFAAGGVAQQPYGGALGYNNLSLNGAQGYNGVYGDNGNFVVVICDVEPEAIEEFSQLLPRVQIADVSLNKNREADRLVEKLAAGSSLQVAGDLQASRADKKEALKQEVAKSDMAAKKLNENGDARVAVAAGAAPPSGNATGSTSSNMAGGGIGGGGGASGPASGSRMAVVDDVRGRSPAGAKPDAVALKATDPAARLGAPVQEAGADQNYEYFRVVANRRQLESALETIRSQPKLYRNLSVEPAAQEATERAHWQAFNRGLPLADAKSELAAQSAKPTLASSAAIVAPKQSPVAPGAVPAAATPAAAAPVAATPALSTPVPTTPSPSAPPPVVAGPALTLPAAPPAAAPGAPPVAKAQIAAQSPPSQPIAPQELRSRAVEQTYEQQQRRSYGFSRSQRISGREIAEQSAGLYSVFNPASEPTKTVQDAPVGAVPTEPPGRQDLAASDLKRSVAEKSPRPAMKDSGSSLPGTGGTGEKATGNEGRIVAKSAAPPAPKSAEAESKPRAAGEAQRLEKDVAGGGIPQATASPAAQSASSAAPTIAPMTPAALLPMPTASPAQVLDDITGANRPLPLVQQPVPQLPQSRSTIQDEQAARQDQVVQQVAGLPDDYHEALFIFRVVKRGSTPAAKAGEAIAPAKPAAATKPTGK